MDVAAVADVAGARVLQIVVFDPKTGFRFDDRPFVITTPRARLELGTYRP